MDKKKMAAIMTAVTSYIETEEAAAYQQTALQGPAMAASVTKEQAAPMNLWGANGRQTQMQIGLAKERVDRAEDEAKDAEKRARKR